MRTRLPAALLLVLALGIATVATPPLAAGELSLDVRLEPREVGVEDWATLTVIIWGEVRGAILDLGKLENLQVIAGPSTQQRHSWVDGVTSQSTQYTYQLRPLTTGPASIGPLTVTVGETNLSSQVMTIEVKRGSLAPPRQERRLPVQGVALDRRPGRPDLREARVELRYLIDNASPFLGEPVTLTLVLDHNIPVDGFEPLSAPAYPGWWAQRVEQQGPPPPHRVEVDGFLYTRNVLDRHVLIPLRSGELVLPPVKIRVWVPGSSVFSPGQRLERATDALHVQVRERPGDPDSFTGGVGALSYRAELQPERVAFGRSAVLTIELSGSGNLPLVAAPELWPSCSGCEIYPPEEENQLQLGASGISGTRTWRTTLVPRLSGELRLEPITISTFDPDTGRYQEQTIGGLTLQVEPPFPDEDAPASPSSAAGQEPTPGGGVPMPWIIVALVLGLAAGGGSTWVLVKRRSTGEPDRNPSAVARTPAERARQLQGELAGWWQSCDEPPALRQEMEQLRAELEAVRFAPGRADHTYTVADLEQRLQSLMRQS